MQYLPTIDLWNRGFNAALRSGQLKLQPGQWVKCGSSKPSRFVGYTGASIWAVHPEKGNKVNMKRFQQLNNIFKNRKP